MTFENSILESPLENSFMFLLVKVVRNAKMMIFSGETLENSKLEARINNKGIFRNMFASNLNLFVIVEGVSTDPYFEFAISY